MLSTSSTNEVRSFLGTRASRLAVEVLISVLKKTQVVFVLISLLALLAGSIHLVSFEGLLSAQDKQEHKSPAWSPQAAARYLDNRETWWQQWDHAKRDHETVCVSCHTQLPYALARPLLQHELKETAIPSVEPAMWDGITKRVNEWDQVEPFYSDAHSGPGKSVESRNAESVLNAVMAAFADAQVGESSDLARAAFAHAWALQSTSAPAAGAWVWQNFHLAPWESTESEYYWAAMMAVAVGKEPDLYSIDPGVKKHLAALNDYLRSHYAEQPLLNKLIALWASRWFPIF